VTDRVRLAYVDREFSMGELDALTAGMVDVLASRGVRSGDRIALMSSNRPEFVFALRAAWALGASVVLLSSAWKRAEVDHALSLTGATHAVGDHPVLADAMDMLHLDAPVAPSERPLPVPDPDSDALFVFSSGTTGMPKAVRHTHRAFAVAIEHWRDALGLGPDDRMQIMTPPSHILGLLNIATALEAGAWLRLHPRFDVDTMLHHIESDRITVEMAVAPIALAFAAHPRLESFDVSSLRYVMWCATPVTRSVAEAVAERIGIRWITAYGASEFPVISSNPPQDTRLDTVGKPVAGVEMRIVSLDDGAVLGACEDGEIQVRSASVMAGYLPDDATATAFDDDWYRTGDVGNLDADGYLRITDRAKEMIKVRGFQVAPAEVESVLHGHPAVADCAVFGVPDPADGEAIVAAVALCGTVDEAELIALIGDRLASYKRPRRVVFVEKIPRLPSGKVLRRVLKERVMSACAKNGGPEWMSV
jgi:long-chain acyl-CoA synthetase